MRTPKYRRRPDRDTAFVEWQGRRYPFPGPYNSAESRAAYYDFCRRVLMQGLPPPKVGPRPNLAQIVDSYLGYALAYYGKEQEFGCLCAAALALIRVGGTGPADRFGPLALDRVRQAGIAGSWIRLGENYRPWSRSYANHQVNRIRRMFRWAVAQELLPASTAHALDALEPLRVGKTAARERPPVQPVPVELVYATEMVATRVLAVMIEVQRLTGMRPSNLCDMRPCDLDRTGQIWVYRPAAHKSAWRGRGLEIFIGPRAQSLLGPLLEGRPADVFVFSPRESETERGRRKFRQRRPVGLKYNAKTYARAVKYLCAKTGIDPWHPYQLRHAAGTRIRAAYGLEGSQVVLGHARADVTEIYAERDRQLALRIAKEAG